MSEMEYHRGKLMKLESNFLSLEGTAEILCRSNGVNKIEDYHDNWIEQFRDTFYKGEYVIIGNDIYKILEGEEFDPDNLNNLEEKEDGTIHYMFSYYNGGASFNEALESLFEEKGFS